MSGKIKQIIDEIIEKNSEGDPILENTTKTKIQMKGILIDKYDETSEDNPEVIQELREIAADLNIDLEH